MFCISLDYYLHHFNTKHQTNIITNKVETWLKSNVFYLHRRT